MVFILERTVVSRKTGTMKNLLTISILAFPLMFSPISFAEWTEVSEGMSGTIRYIDFERIRKHGEYVFFWQMSDYLEPTSKGYLSALVYSKVDCNVFRKKTLTEHYFMEQMGRGTPVVWDLTEFQKEWMYPPPDTSFEEVLNAVCSR